MSETAPSPDLSSSVPPYPPAPWLLRGWAFQTLSLVDLANVRARLPEGLRVVRVGPRHTLGGVYVATYGPGSVLEYHELIVLPALVWRKARLGFWVSHIYVDHPASAAGGRDLWNLPKELAEFAVAEEAHGRRVTVRQGGTPLAVIEHQIARAGVPLTVPLPAFGTLNDPPRFFVGRARSRLGTAASRVQIPLESPLAGLGLDRPFLGLCYADLELLAAAPKVTAASGATR
jgi:acetoacetate decarboxylase